MGRLRRIAPAGMVFIVSFAVYLRTLCPTVFVEGTGENIVCAWTLGVPHPPGFPLFCLLSKAFAEVVRVGTIAYRVNLFSALAGAAAVSVLYELLGALGTSRLAAAAAALSFAFSATFWRQAVIAEVYTLSMILVLGQISALVCWREALRLPAGDASPSPAARKRQKARQRAATAPDGSGNPDRWLLPFALAFGLGLAVHYNHLLLLPAWLYFILATDRAVLRSAGTTVKAALLILLGFSLHLYAPIRSRSNPPIDWGNPETLANWWRYLTAEQYRGRMFHLPLTEVISNLRAFVADLPAELWWAGLLAAAGGGLVLFRRDRRFFWTTVIIVAVTLTWAVNYDIPWEINVYYLHAILALVVWAAFGLHWLADRAARSRLRPAAVVCLALPAALLLTNFPANDLSRETFVVQNARDTLSSAEPDSAIILPQTNPTFALIYLTRVERQSPAVQLWSRLPTGGIAPTDKAVRPAAEVPAVPEPAFIAKSLREGRAVYTVERQPAGALSGFAQVPWGALYRILPAEEAEAARRLAPSPSPLPASLRPPDYPGLRYGAEARLIACRYLLVQADYAWERDHTAEADRLYREVEKIGMSLSQVAAQLGMRYAEQGRIQMAVKTYEGAIARKDDALLRNRLGVIYGRQNRLAEAETHLRRAISLDPDCADAHANLGSVYGRRGNLQEAIKETEAALDCDPNNLTALRNLGFAYAQMDRKDEARRLLERALKINPNQPQVRALLDRL